MTLFDEPRFAEMKISGRLPSPKGVALEVISLAQKDDVSNQDFTRLISSDPALSARVIKAANVLLGKTARPLSSIADAVTVLGMRALRQLVLGIAMILDYKNGPCKEFNYRHFWMHSLLTGIAARHLAQQSRFGAADEVFVVGLLSAIGRLGLATVFTEEYGTLLKQIEAQPAQDILKLEMGKFGFDEHELSEAILTDLNFPKIFQSLVREYEHPESSLLQAGTRDWRLLYLLNIATLLADLAMETPAQRGKLIAQLKTTATKVGIETDALIEIGDACTQDWRAWSTLLGMEKLDIPPFAELLQQVDEAAEAAVFLPQYSGNEQAAYPLRVLVVEDDRSSRTLLEHMLKSAGHQVTTASNGVEALQMIQQHQPQIVITDWLMPHMDGITLCRKLRENPQWCDLYLIVMTAQGDSDKLVEAFEAGADDYLIKPIIPKIFFSRLLAGSRVVQLQVELALDREQLVRLSTDLSAANQHLQLLALTDVLTGLPNRRAAMERLEQEWALSQRGGRPLSCMMIDIDHFKSINDRFGHPVGDVALKSVALALRQSARTQDVVARIGGEEFLVICPGTDATEAFQCAERLRKNVEALSLAVATPPLKVTVSMGVSVKAPGMASIEALLNLADQNLYTAKQTGRNKTVLN
ncbi:MAG: diguanylate cyclase [Sideroxydans sp.]|nr:diguanylate cyclase [Sideroxydans sp.]